MLENALPCKENPFRCLNFWKINGSKNSRIQSNPEPGIAQIAWSNPVQSCLDWLGLWIQWTDPDHFTLWDSVGDMSVAFEAGTLDLPKAGAEICWGLRVTPPNTKNSSDIGHYFSEKASFHEKKKQIERLKT